MIFIVSQDNGAEEYEIELDQHFQLKPAVAGRINSLGGVPDMRLN